jgi:hypothetical protein
LLNGQTYEDALLHAGDRLRVGPVELEVVECQAGSAQSAIESLLGLPVDVTQPVEPTDSSSHHAKTQELEACLAEANDEIARLEADANQAWQASIVASERSEQLRPAFEQVNAKPAKSAASQRRSGFAPARES